MADVFQIKAIKSKKLNVKAYRDEIEKALRAEGKNNEKELKKTVATWRNKPDFESIVDVTGGEASVLTGPTGDTKAVQHWVWTDEGTRPHVIRPRNAPRLRFRAGSSPKTLPGTFKSRRGRKFGPVVYARIVHHPGTIAREWTPDLQRRRRRPFTRRMVKAMQAASRNAF